MVIAEDEALIRLDLKEMLEEDGYAVVGEAGDGETAVKMALEHAARSGDPGCEDAHPGRDLGGRADRVAADRAGLILTAFSQRDLVERARDAGAMAYLVKPFTKSDLVPAIEMAVSRYEEMAALEREVGTLSERLETRKLVERAKGLLHGAARVDRAAGVPVDPEGVDGPQAEYARRWLRSWSRRCRGPRPGVRGSGGLDCGVGRRVWPCRAVGSLSLGRSLRPLVETSSVPSRTRSDLPVLH